MREVYHKIVQSASPLESFIYFARNKDKIENGSNTQLQIEDDDLKISLYVPCNNMMEGIVGMLICRNSEEVDFYTQLWEKLQDDKIFETEEEKIYAFINIWVNEKIPYYHLDMSTRVYLSDEEYTQTVLEKKDLLERLRFIMALDLDQRTEQSGLIVGLLDQCQYLQEKAVVLAQVMDLVDKRRV